MTEDQLRRMTKADLARVLNWRNDIEVRRFMYSSHKITAEEHYRWFERATKDTGTHLFIYEVAGRPNGFMNIHTTKCPEIAEWGFYVAPESPPGTGSKMGRVALECAFNCLKFHKVCGYALGNNHRSIRFHEKLGFQREGVLREQHYDGRSYQDVVCFGILDMEWKTGTREKKAFA